ncbi:MAG: triose-phosphate isomerase [Deltaproteobacteria bacterium]|nr:triose-phosphate isomerase [Deltaproteobacteria bacterium]
MKKSATRRPLIAGNWKMHATRAESVALIDGIKAAAAGARDREVVVAPPYTALETVARAIADTAIGLAGQNLHWESKGAFTGEIAGEMLKDVGCTYVIVGHSERRLFFSETNETVRQKIAAALRAGLKPIVCIGETLREREGDNTLPVIERQVRDGLAEFGRDVVRGLAIAYEPVWAIGTGQTATPEQAQEVHAAIRALLRELAGDSGGEAVRILYGGSVKADNIDSLIAQPDIDGALVGGASLDAAAFARIIAFR